jgi:membrane-bound lytic murein transglycosylase D
MLALASVAACTTTTSRQVSSVPDSVPVPVTQAVAPPVRTATPSVPAPIVHADLWARIRAGMHLADMDNKQVREFEDWYANRPRYVDNMFRRSRLYLYDIVEEIERRKLPMELALLPAIESAYRPTAYSRARAVGLWQFISSTGRLYGLKQDWWYDGRRDSLAATRAALDYLEKLHAEFGDWRLALAAYNAGERRVARAREANARRGGPTHYESLQLKRETRHYVPKLMAVVHIVRDPQRFGLELPDFPNQPEFAVVDAGGQIDLGVAARLGGISADELYALNAGYLRWATPPDGPHKLVVPRENSASLATALADLPPKDRLRWARHHVRQGDTLGHIANRYGISISALQQSNHLRGNLIHVGQDLVVPLSSRNTARQVASLPRAPKESDTAGNRKRLVHTVQRGDTLWQISRQYRVGVRQLASWNGLHLSDTLRLGRGLVIWY